jgi:hypothetical protein
LQRAGALAAQLRSHRPRSSAGLVGLTLAGGFASGTAALGSTGGTAVALGAGFSEALGELQAESSTAIPRAR